MATAGGARALGWQDELGALTPGYRANIILVRESGWGTVPSNDPATNIVYSCSPADVEMTIVNGRILLEDGAIRSFDEDRLRAVVVEQRNRLFERAGLM